MTEQSTSKPSAKSPQLAETAREWLLYLYSQDADDQGRADFSAWLDQSPDHAAAFADAEQLWRDIALIEGIEEELASAGQASSVKPKVGVAVARSPWWGDWFGRRGFIVAGLAASVLALLGMWWGQLYDPVEVQQFATGTGVDKSQTVLLKDGSQVTLDAASTLVARFSKQQRTIELLRGSAYFEVAPHAENVFRLTVAGNEIRVLGTEFDVRRRADDIQISVTEGAVQVSSIQGSPPQGVAAAAVKLTAGQQVVATLDGHISDIQGFNATKVLAWREGRLVYDNARLADVIADINRYRQKKVALVDEWLSDIRVTTAFTVDQSDQVLAALAASKPVIIEDQGFRVIVREKK